ncbi:valine--pyruvate transaminase [Dongshaea marina]|uniref:valine--pyruvate transaminase n=1 Tax=Dongshaea marina TaxID=2047966 RepID=UPI000D3E41F0|nr:valine--pyruvate transaminase [Dongshaea marina]
MKLSQFGEKLAAQSSIVELMEDLNQGLNDPDTIMLGGGNPAFIPEVARHFEQEMAKMLNQGTLVKALSRYDSPSGNDSFKHELAEMLNQLYGWPITEKNLALTNGSQSSFFYLFNLFAGRFSDGSTRQVVFPMAPEYLGYADSTIDPDSIRAVKPLIEEQEGGFFKYHPDLNNLGLTNRSGLICLSRPTNPSGNLISDSELKRLAKISAKAEIPLLIDCAYGLPFPNICFNRATPYWDHNCILSLSLSKLGFPGTRCGIIVADEQLIATIRNINGMINLAPGAIGPRLLLNSIKNRKLLELADHTIRPYYQERCNQAIALLRHKISDKRVLLHQPEGSLFLWLWLKNLPVTSFELYKKLKDRGLLVVPGEPFFSGVDDKSWPHQSQCLRLNYTQPLDELEKGYQILADTLSDIGYL